MGLLNSWKVSGLTTEGAKLSSAFHQLGTFLGGDVSDLDKSVRDDIVAFGKQLILMHEYFEEYVLNGNKQHYVECVKFLVIFAATALGNEGGPWRWQEVRSLSQGLVGSLDDTPATFASRNLPIITKMAQDVAALVYSAEFSISTSDKSDRAIHERIDSISRPEAEPSAPSIKQTIEVASPKSEKKWCLVGSELLNVQTGEKFLVVDKLFLNRQEIRREGRGYIFAGNSPYVYVNDWDIETFQPCASTARSDATEAVRSNWGTTQNAMGETPQVPLTSGVAFADFQDAQDAQGVQRAIINDPPDIDAFYDSVGKELEDEKLDRATWTRAFAEADGNDAKARAAYIQLRVAKLVAAYETEKAANAEAERLAGDDA